MTRKVPEPDAEKEVIADAEIESEANIDVRRARMIEKLREEIDQERYDNEQDSIAEEREAGLREQQLEVTERVLQANERAFTDYTAAANQQEDWTRYTACDGLPDPGSLSDMNTYMYLWTMQDERCDMDALATRTEDVLYLLSRLDEITRTTSSDRLIECKEIKEKFRNKLRQWMDIATYRLLRRIDNNMAREDLRNARYSTKSTQFICCIWALIRLPLSMGKSAPKDRKSVEINFEELELSIKLPLDVDCYRMAIRGLWLNYDHYSDTNVTYEMPKLPDELVMREDLLSYVQEEYQARLRIREDQTEERKLRLAAKMAVLEKLENPTFEKTAAKISSAKTDKKGKKKEKGKKEKKKAVTKKAEFEQETEALAALKSIPYLPTPRQIILLAEEEARKERERLLLLPCEQTEINLRKYRILGGTIDIDLLYQPPQPKDMRGDILLTTLQVPKELRRVPFSRTYTAPTPVPDAERTPEIIEAEIKALEAAMEALVLITVSLPDRVLWMEPPLICRWVEDKRVWSTADIHDVKYNEEKQSITFRSGRLGVHGLAAHKFTHLPYQGWELKPEAGRSSGGGVTLSIATATVQVEFIVREDTVCLSSLMGGTSTALRQIIGNFMKLHLLIEKMREAGCDVFPERDAYSYVKGLSEKHPIAERHLRRCIGLLCTAYSFSWSRWNSDRSPREIVLLYKELHGCVAKQRATMTLLVTPLRTVTVDCTEVSSKFSDAPVDSGNGTFYADLYNMALRNAGVKTRMLMRSVPFKLALTVAKLLECTNVIGMSS